MILNKETVYTQDTTNKKIKVVREFEAPVEKVWNAWTDSSILDRWWAPKPWKAVTKSMDFSEGGTWLYYMEGPNGERQYCRADYTSVIPGKSFAGDDGFCDENGTPSKEMPSMHWDVRFNGNGPTTKVVTEISFASEADMDKIIEMGFKEGFAAAHQNLDEVLAG
jgi:uncharacterized protein YndB with AHSA1/START domain